MKRIATYTMTLIVGIATGLVLSGCASTRIKQLSGAEFVDQADEIEQMNSFHWTTYVGRSSQRAYLEFGHPAFIGKGVRTTLFWTPLSELPDEISKKLKEGDVPWKSWHSGTNGLERVVPGGQGEGGAANAIANPIPMPIPATGKSGAKR